MRDFPPNDESFTKKRATALSTENPNSWPLRYLWASWFRYNQIITKSKLNGIAWFSFRFKFISIVFVLCMQLGISFYFFLIKNCARHFLTKHIFKANFWPLNSECHFARENLNERAKCFSFYSHLDVSFLARSSENAHLTNWHSLPFNSIYKTSFIEWFTNKQSFVIIWDSAKKP